MENNAIIEIRNLIDKLNNYRDAYYNKNESLISDKQYDELYDRLESLEKIANIIFSDSPTQTVGYPVQDKLNKVKHDHYMLSLDKTKEVNDIVKFSKYKSIVATLKMDGLTCSLHYDKDGDLIGAETRGNGKVGEDILENAKHITNIPLHINNNGIPLVVDGEVIIDYNTFNQINTNGEFSNPRNLASGSIRQLDTKITAERKLKFIAWKMIDGVRTNLISNSLEVLSYLGFEVVPYELISNPTMTEINKSIKILKDKANDLSYPIDGLVFTFEDIKYGNSLGNTSHSPRHSMAFKFYDDCYETILRDIEWNTTRTGMVAPVAVFDPIDLDGALTSRATLHNISIMKELELGIGDTISIYRANSVIPKIDDNLTRSNSYEYPTKCPCCGEELEIRKEGIAEVFYCTNEECPSKNLSKFVHFTSKSGVDIEGLSESTIEKFIDRGFIKSYKDIYHLNRYKNDIINIDGFGEKSYNNLIRAIKKSKDIKFEKFIQSLGINHIGEVAAKNISKKFNNWNEFKEGLNNKFDFSTLSDFGNVANKSIYSYFNNNIDMVDELAKEFNFIIEEELEIENNDFITGKTFVVTGRFNSMTRAEIEETITKCGGRLSGSVNSKTDFLLTNDTTSGSSKNKKAAELGIPIMSEEEFISKLQ